MGKKTIPAEDRIAQFFKMFFNQQEKILSMRYAYDTNRRFPEGLDKLDPDIVRSAIPGSLIPCCIGSGAVHWKTLRSR